MINDIWYFAFGSNLSKKRMEARTGPIQKAIPAFLARFRLAFNKGGDGGEVYASIVPCAERLFGAWHTCAIWRR